MVEFWLLLFALGVIFSLVAIYGFIVPFLVSLDSTLFVIVGAIIGLVVPFVTVLTFLNFMKWVNTKFKETV